MSSSVAAILDGFDYQAFWFWWLVCQMLKGENVVARVGYEVNEYTAFDDVAIEYTQPAHHGTTCLGEYYSIKYSVNYQKEITAESLGDPGLINATAVSLLERLRDAVARMKASGKDHQFVLAAPWGLLAADPITKLVDTQSGKIRMNVLYDGTGRRGEMGSLRARWCELLKLSSENELMPILARLRIEPHPPTQQHHLQELDVLLQSVGLAPIPTSGAVVLYFPLVQKLFQSNRWFDAARIRDECRLHNLVAKEPRPKRNAHQLAIRSFDRFSDGLDQVDHLLCMLEHFDGRMPRTEHTWNRDVPDKVAGFLGSQLKPQGEYDLHLHCFGSMAFQAGYLAEPKIGASVAVVQRLYGRPAELWTVDHGAVASVSQEWKFDECQLGLGKEIAVAVSLTHDIGVDVCNHCRNQIPEVGRVIIAVLPQGASYMAVASGTHAFALAQRLKNHVSPMARNGPLHLFWAAPNAFAFFMGQVSRPLGLCRLYEYDMDSKSYRQSMDLSPAQRLDFNPA